MPAAWLGARPEGRAALRAFWAKAQMGPQLLSGVTRKDATGLGICQSHFPRRVLLLRAKRQRRPPCAGAEFGPDIRLSQGPPDGLISDLRRGGVCSPAPDSAPIAPQRGAGLLRNLTATGLAAVRPPARGWVAKWQASLPNRAVPPARCGAAAGLPVFPEAENSIVRHGSFQYIIFHVQPDFLIFPKISRGNNEQSFF